MQDIRETFGRMAMNDEETVALLVKQLVKLTERTEDHVQPEGALEQMGLVNQQRFRAWHAITSGIRAWTANPTQWDNGYFDLLFGYEWELTKSQLNCSHKHAIDQKEEDMAPDAEDGSKKVPTMMTTADMTV